MVELVVRVPGACACCVVCTGGDIVEFIFVFLYVVSMRSLLFEFML